MSVRDSLITENRLCGHPRETTHCKKVHIKFKRKGDSEMAKLSLEQLSRKIGDSRASLSKLHASLQSAITLYDKLDSDRDSLASEIDGAEKPTDEQIASLAKHDSDIKESRLKNIGLSDQIQAAKDSLTDLENDLKLRQSSNDMDEFLSSSSGRGTGDLGSLGAGTSGNVRVLPLTSEQLDHDLSVYMAAEIISQSSRRHIEPSIVAMEFGNERVAASLTHASMQANDHDAGGSWISGTYSDRFIELLRPESIVRQMGVDVVPLDDGTMTMAKETGGPSGVYLGENQDADVEVLTTGDVKLIAKELVCIVPASDKLLRSRSAKAAERIRNSIIRGAGQTEDLYFIRGIAASAGPTGMRYLALAANILAANGTVNLANVTNDLGKMELRLLANNVVMRRPAWAMSPRTLIYLSDLRDGNGNLAYPSLSMGDRPMLRRKPVFVTSQIPETLGSGDKSEIYLVEASHLIIGDAPRIALDASNTAAYNDGGTVKAAFSGRKTLVRLVMENDFNTLHAGAISVLTGVNWGV